MFVFAFLNRSLGLKCFHDSAELRLDLSEWILLRIEILLFVVILLNCDALSLGIGMICCPVSVKEVANELFRLN